MRTYFTGAYKKRGKARHRRAHPVALCAAAAAAMVAALGGPAARRAQAADARVEFVETFIGAAGWQYDLTVYNDLPSPAFNGFGLYQIELILDNGTSVTDIATPTNWFSFTGPGLLDFASLLPGVPPAGTDIPPATELGGFRFTASTRVGAVPFTALFTDPNDVDPPNNPRVYNGITAPSGTATVPEASSFALLCAGAAATFLPLPGVVWRSRARRKVL